MQLLKDCTVDTVPSQRAKIAAGTVASVPGSKSFKIVDYPGLLWRREYVTTIRPIIKDLYPPVVDVYNPVSS